MAVILLVFFNSMAFAADVNVLIVGTTYDTGEYGTNTYGTSKAFDIAKVRTELETILTGSGMGSVQVSLHDYSSNGPSWGYGNRLIEEFLSKDASYPPIDADFWTKLRGEGAHPDWDVVILIGEPYTIEYFPGLYTLGASEIRKEVAKGGAETVLFMGWPAAGSGSTVDHYKEVVYRTGRSMGCKVVPAGLAWQDQGSVQGTSHPTNDGAFLAAAAIYSRVWGVEGQDRSVSEFTNGNDALADAVHNVVKANKGAVQYTGKFTHPSNVFAMMNDSRREWRMGSMNSSTEYTIRRHTELAGRAAGMDVGGVNVDSGPNGIHVARNGNSLNAGFDMTSRFIWPTNDNAITFTNRIDTDLGAYLRQIESELATYPNARHLPDPALWAQAYKRMPSTPFIEAQHGGRGWGMSSGAYLITLMSGRCPMIPDLAEPTIDSNAFQVGYETAWRMMTLQGRAPGFKVMPSDWKRHTVDPEAPETMTVRFMFQPTHDVTVNIATDQTWVTVTPTQLTFTPENYNTPREVTVSLAPEAAGLRGEVFNVSYTTTSGDEVCNNLFDSWEYAVNTPPVVFPVSESVQAGADLVTTMLFEDPDLVTKNVYSAAYFIAKQTITYEIVSGPDHGEIAVNGATITYTADADFTGIDTIVYRVNDGLTNSVTDEAITITILASGQYGLNLLANPAADFGTTSWVITNDFLVSNGRFATSKGGRRPNPSVSTLHQDVDLSDYSAAINAGLQEFNLSGYLSDTATLGDYESRILLEFRDINGNVLGATYDSQPALSGSMVYKEATLLAPANAVTARFILRAERLVGVQGYMYFDNLSLTAVRPPNRAPVAVDPPQLSIAQNVPSIVTLEATDLDRFPSDTLTFEIVLGPDPAKGQITGWQDGMPIYTPNQDFLGEDSFTFRVFDGQLWSANTATASILVRENEAPSIVVHTPVMPAETNTIYMAATNGLIFETTVTDDGGPYPSNLTINWEQTGGPVTAVFGNPNAENTTCNWGDMNPGTYGFKVTASDGQLDTVVEFTVTVLNGGYDIPENVAPQVDVGGPYSSVSVGETLTLQGSSLSDDGEPLVPGVTTVEWLKVSGPGIATFANASTFETDVVFNIGGTYVLRLTGDDGEVKSYEDLTVIVDPNIAPDPNAGPDQTVTLTQSAGGGDPVAGAFYEWDAAKDTGGNNLWPSTTANSYDWQFGAALSPTSVADARFDRLTFAYEFPAAKSQVQTTLQNSLNENSSGTWEFVLDTDAEDGLIMESGGTTDGIQFWIAGGVLNGQVRDGGTNATVSYTLTTNDKSRFIHVVYVINMETDLFKLYVDNVEADSVTWTGADWCGSDSGALGTVGGSAPAGSVADFTGKMALIRFYENKAFIPAEVDTNFGALSNGLSAVVNLNGSAIDPDGPTLTTAWSVVSTSPAGLSVEFGDAASPVTTATFVEAGVYTLRLTAEDGFNTDHDDVIITVNQDGIATIADVDLPAGISLYGYTGQTPIDALTAFQTLIDNSQLSLVRWVNPGNGQIKELYYTTFPSAGWINEIGDLTLGQGYVVKTTAACTLSVTGNKDTGNVTHELPAGYSIIGFNKETPVDAQAAFQELITASKLELVRWVDPSNGSIKELYYTTFPSSGWVNEIGNLTEGQGYIIKLNATHTGFSIP